MVGLPALGANVACAAEIRAGTTVAVAFGTTGQAWGAARVAFTDARLAGNAQLTVTVGSCIVHVAACLRVGAAIRMTGFDPVGTRALIDANRAVGASGACTAGFAVATTRLTSVVAARKACLADVGITASFGVATTVVARR